MYLGLGLPYHENKPCTNAPVSISYAILVAMEILSLLCLFLFSYVRAVNTGNQRPREIAYGAIVDYSQMKISYPFMARLIIDSERCGGVVIADR